MDTKTFANTMPKMSVVYYQNMNKTREAHNGETRKPQTIISNRIDYVLHALSDFLRETLVPTPLIATEKPSIQIHA